MFIFRELNLKTDEYTPARNTKDELLKDKSWVLLFIGVYTQSDKGNIIQSLMFHIS